jgi:hypothetical protein
MLKPCEECSLLVPHSMSSPSLSSFPLTLPASLTHPAPSRYENNNNRVMSSSAAAQLLSVTLYYRRFFPYYAFNLVAGLDEKGRGAVFGYDAVGSFKRDEYGAMGSGQNFIMPILDNLVPFLLPPPSPLLTPGVGRSQESLRSKDSSHSRGGDLYRERCVRDGH